MTRYRFGVEGLRAAELAGFFEGWPDPPAPETHLRLLAGSAECLLAIDGDGTVAGFVTAIADGVLCAQLPLLEVRPEYRGRGIGSELVRRMVERLSSLYALDLSCDPGLVPFYERLGFKPMQGMALRRYERQAGSSE